MDFRYLNRTDLIVIGACALSLTIFIINTELDSVVPLYLSNLVVLSVFVYWSIRKDVTGMLRRSLIIGSVGSVCYTFIDRLFVEWRIITYLRSEDLDIFATPVSVVLTWIYCIATMLYLYQRLRSTFSRFYIPSALTGASAFLSSIILDHLGAHARLWTWTWNTALMPAPPPSIGSTPLFVPVALLLTFFFSPYILGGQRISARIRLSDNPIAGGLRCAIILGMIVYISLRVLAG